ncbi:MAG: carboxylating nicotinate-nucleotide diphosphorylase [Myxococcota bacterium]|nr:carboxylating nicotinate-nucleotide diphosphorylase [Myxococcota bacterium]
MTVEEIVRAALAEDLGTGDLTSLGCVEAGVLGRGIIDARQSLVVSGLEPARLAFEARGAEFVPQVTDGDRVEAGTVVAEVRGQARALLEAERVALNFLMWLSGIATHTRSVVQAAEGQMQVLDTRKTTPLHRVLEKSAVLHGGGSNHRMGLYDMVLIKENHIRAAGGVAEAVRRARSVAPAGVQVEVEVETLEELTLALDAGAELVLLDNMDDVQLQEAVKACRGRALTEASGGMNAERIARVARLGLDRVSVGGLIHQARWVDFGMDLDQG